MKTGLKFQILLSVVVYKTELHREITVRPLPLLNSEANPNNHLGKKLKRRLEDLERRAGSSSASPPQTYAEVKPVSSNNNTRKSSPPQKQSSSSSRPEKLSPRSALQHNAYTPPLPNDDDLFSMHNFSSSSSSGAHTPPYFGYSGYPSPEADFNLYPTPSYTTTASYPTYPAYTREEPQYAYMSPPQQTLPTLPRMAHFDMQPKKEDLALNPFSMSYASMAGLDMQNQYDDGTYPADPLSL